MELSVKLELTWYDFLHIHALVWNVFIMCVLFLNLLHVESVVIFHFKAPSTDTSHQLLRRDKNNK